VAKGRAGHAAFAGAEKASAILELAHKTIAIEALNDLSRQLVVNVGTVAGGIGANTVAETAEIRVDTRFLTKLDGEICFNNISRIVANSTVPGTSAKVGSVPGREPMEKSAGNLALYHLLAEIGADLGMQIGDELRSGVSDANTLASAGLPVLDGLGPIGADDHSDREYMIRDSLLPRTLLAALTLSRGWEKFGSSGSRPV